MTRHLITLRALTLIAISLGIALLLGCSAPTTPTPPPATLPPLPPPTTGPESTPTAAATELPGAVPTFPPVAGSTLAVSTPRKAATRTLVSGPGTIKIKIFMIATEDNGKAGKKIGCNDSVVAVERVIASTTAPLTSSIRELVAQHDQFYGQSGLYNALYQSSLQVNSVSLSKGKATVNLKGTLVIGGTCDAPRVTAQIQETALQFSTVKQVVVLVNGVALDKVLSGK